MAVVKNKSFGLLRKRGRQGENHHTFEHCPILAARKREVEATSSPPSNGIGNRMKRI